MFVSEEVEVSKRREKNERKKTQLHFFFALFKLFCFEKKTHGPPPARDAAGRRRRRRGRRGRAAGGHRRADLHLVAGAAQDAQAR